MTPEQRKAAGAAARKMLAYALSRQPRSSILVISSLEAVALTAESDPVASSGLLRRVIEPGHLVQHGHEELRWIASHMVSLAKTEMGLAIDVYKAAYSFEDTQSDKTNVGNSAILSLTSNRRQDYQGAWYLLEEAMPTILDKDPEGGSRAIARALEGYVAREHPPYQNETRVASTFDVGGFTGSYLSDHSSSWYRGGYISRHDGPALLKKFDEYLGLIAATPKGEQTFRNIVETLRAEKGLAVLWQV